MTWDELENGELLAAAFNAGFDAFLSIDKKIEYEQNLLKLPLTVVVLDSFSNSMTHLIEFVPAVLTLLSTELTRSLYVISTNGSVARLMAPR